MNNMNHFNLVLQTLHTNNKYTGINTNKWSLITLFLSQITLRSWSKKHLGLHPIKEIKQNLGVFVKSHAIESLKNSDQMLPGSESTGALTHSIKTVWNLCISVLKAASILEFHSRIALVMKAAWEISSPHLHLLIPDPQKICHPFSCKNTTVHWPSL